MSPRTHDRLIRLSASLLALALLTACGSSQDGGGKSLSQYAADKAQQGIEQARSELGKARDEAGKAQSELTTGNLTLNGSGSGVPKAELTAAGELLIDGHKVDATPAQTALLKRYRTELQNMAAAGMDVGLQGADVGLAAASAALSGIASGKPEDIEARIKPHTDRIEAEARKLCDRLPSLLEAQTALAAAMPAFQPYATMTADDIKDCRTP